MRIFGRGQRQIDWVDLSSVPELRGTSGRLGMTWLEQVLRGLPGTDRLVLLVEDHELAMVGARDVGARLAGRGVVLVRHPIVDHDVPDDPVAFDQLLDDIRAWVRAGESVAVACYGGLGRTGTVVACVLGGAGLDANSAIRLTRSTRPGAIETAEQELFVRRHLL
jgi:protein-tyrosine phosphatase